MTRIRRALALLLAVLLCAAAIYAWRPAPVSDPAAGPAVSGLPAAVERAAPTPDPVSAPPTLPPGQTTLRRAGNSALADIAPGLQARADAGDARAACRLGTDLLRCRFVAGWSDEQIEQMASRESELAAKGNLDQANSIAMTLLRHAELQRLCAGLDETLLARGGQYLRQAALAGEPDAVVRYAAGGAFRATGSNSFIATPEFDQWRREAPAMIQRALEAGEPGAVLLMLQSHSMNHDFLPWVTPPDPDAAATSLALARRVFGEDFNTSHFDIPVRDDPRRLADAERRAAELYARHFDGQPQDFARAAHGLVPLHDVLGVHDWPQPGVTVPLGEGCRPRGGP